MRNSRLFVSAFAATALLTVSACVTDPNTGEKKVSRTAIGGVGGAAIGYTMDKQIKELKEQTAGSGVDVSEIGDGQGILVNLPDGVTFAVNSTTISPTFQSTLDTIANSMVQYPNSLVDVMGHTDSTGSDAYNEDLSKRRADAVAGYLTLRGVSRARIATIGYGERYPVAENATEEGRARNRRVEIKITPVSQDEVNAARN